MIAIVPVADILARHVLKSNFYGYTKGTHGFVESGRNRKCDVEGVATGSKDTQIVVGAKYPGLLKRFNRMFERQGSVVRLKGGSFAKQRRKFPSVPVRPVWASKAYVVTDGDLPC
jgi:hypothetical protein